VCTCKAGYAGDGTTCTNIDACSTTPCESGQTCTDLPPPAAGDASGRTCVTPNPCDAVTCDVNAMCLIESPASAYCACNPGYGGLGTPGNCVDVNACDFSPCEPGYTCSDLPPPAFSDPTGRTCTPPADECTLPSACDVHASCTDTPSAPPVCECEMGYIGSGQACAPSQYEGWANTVQGISGTLTSLDSNDVTLGIDFLYMGSGATLDGIVIDGLSSQTDATLALYNSIGDLLALSTVEISSVPMAVVNFSGSGPALINGQQYRLAIYTTAMSSSPLQVFSPSSLPYFDYATGNVRIFGGYTSAAGLGQLSYPTATSSSVAQVSFNLSTGGGGSMCMPSPCDARATCDDTLGSPVCTCTSPYETSGSWCTAAPSGGVDLVSGSPGSLGSGFPSVGAYTYGADFTMTAGNFSLAGISLDGIDTSMASVVEVAVFEPTGETQLGSATVMSGETQAFFSSPISLLDTETYVVAVRTDSFSVVLFTPAAFPYETSTSGVQVTGGRASASTSVFGFPQGASEAIPQISLIAD
jgi:hypothetical protein